MSILLTPADRDRIAELRQRGAAWADIAPLYDVPRNILSAAYRRVQAKQPKRKPSGPLCVVVALDGIGQPYCIAGYDSEHGAAQAAAFQRRAGRKAEVYRRAE